MSPVLVNTVATVALMATVGALLGATGTYYLVTAAGLPHFILGFIFAFLAVLRGRRRRRGILAALGAASVVACAAYARFPLNDLVGAYFVVHMFRDEVFMFLNRRAGFDAVAVADAAAGGSAAARVPDLARVWVAGRLLIVIALAAFATGRLAVAQRGPLRGGLFTDPAAHLTGSATADLALGALLILLVGLLACAPARLLSALHLPPEAREFLVLFLVVAFAAYLREATLFLALFHYVSWYLFYGDKLRAREAAAEPSPAGVGFWFKVMNRGRPFAMLMLAANVLSVAGLALYLRFPGGLDFLAVGYEYAYFPYWTIPHVTLSFLPRR